MITFVPSQSIRVLLVDDEPLLRRSLRIAIDREPDLTVVVWQEPGARVTDIDEGLRVDVRAAPTGG